MNPRVKDLYTNVSVHATADREHEAVVELLVLTMMADKHISSDEIDSIRSLTADAGWDGETFSFDQYIGQAVATVRAAVNDHHVDELLDSIDSRITSRVLRGSLFAACRDIAGIDNDVNPAEESLLGHIAARFD